MKDTGNSQQTESLLLSDGVLVGYAVEEGVEDVQNEQQEFRGIARRGRKRAFAIRHHRVDGGGGGGGGNRVGQGDDVRLELEQVMQQVGGLERQYGRTSREDDVCTLSQQGYGTLTPREDDGGQAVQPVRMGRGGHALTVDATMMNMMMSSRKNDLTTKRVSKSQPKRRRQQTQTTPVGRRKSTGLGDRILSAQLDPSSGGSNVSPMQDFMSTLPAPSQLLQSRARMRAPATLTQLAESLDDRLHVLASTRAGSTVSTLKLRLQSVHMIQGKMTCRCWCDTPMGVLPDHDVTVVMRSFSEIDGLVTHQAETASTVEGHEIIVSKPWLILESAKPVILLCLGDVAHRYVPHGGS